MWVDKVRPPLTASVYEKAGQRLLCESGTVCPGVVIHFMQFSLVSDSFREQHLVTLKSEALFFSYKQNRRSWLFANSKKLAFCKF